MKQLSLENLYNKNGKLNNAVLRQDWFKTSELLQDIIAIGVALGGNPNSISELIFLYKTRIKRPDCNFCINQAKFSSKHESYLDHCGTRSCAAKSVAPKRIETNIKLYGKKVSSKVIDGARQRATELNSKGRQTLLKRYGVTNPGQMVNHLQKVRDTLIENWNVNHQAKIDYVVESRKKNSIEFYRSLSSSVEVNQIFFDEFKLERYANPCASIEFKCSEHGTETLPSETFKWRSRRFDTPCSACLRPYGTASIAQVQLANWIESLGLTIKVGDRTLIDPYELDIVIPELKIAIEYDGLYWHSTTDHAPDNRHINKLKDVEAIGWTLIRIFEDEWNLKRDIVKSMLKSKFGLTKKIYARQCVLDENVTVTEAQTFLYENHLQGKCRSNTRIGLRKDNVLVALLTLSQSRFKQGEIELTRFCSIKDYTIVGGFSKLLAKVENGVISYADRRYSTGNGYLKVGFDLIETTKPGYAYTDLTQRFNRLKFQKHKLSKLLSNFDSSKTEHENMIMHRYRKIWDCGQLKLVLNRTK